MSKMAANGKASKGLKRSGTTSFRKEVETSFAQVGQVIKAIVSPVPKYDYTPNNDNTTAKTGLLKDLKDLGFSDVKTLLELFDDDLKGLSDDDSLIQERLIVALQKLPATSKDGEAITNAFINQLWNGLQHPPLQTLDPKFQYREPDGSYNNIRQPELGAANTAYARSVTSSVLQNVALPDPGVIFDTMMARNDTFEEHPAGVSSVLFYLASIIIHDLFRTDHKDFWKSKTSSYLDLAPLYGSDKIEQDAMRTMKDGKIKPDCFSEKRLLGFPPGVGVFLIMFNRMHNYIVTQLALINENGRFTPPKDSSDEAGWKKYDNDLFQTGRLINCGLYVNIILKDYVRTILSLNHTSSTWDLDPRVSETKKLLSTPAPEGTGNQVSAEFNLIYRWHSAISKKDEKWTEDEYNRLFSAANMDPEEASLEQLLTVLGRWEATLDSDPAKRPFAGLSRQEDGTYPEEQLVKIFQESVEDVAGSFGPNRVPNILRSVEILGMIQARNWNMATLNEFRSFFGLTKHKTFEDITGDKKSAEQLKNLYDHPDFVELYPGLVAEKAKPPMYPGSGLCVNYTTSRAILSDAVTLVRGDRFYTIDYTPKALTNWGFSEVQYDLSVDQGHVMHKLILRAFPNYIAGDSIYAHFPFVIPSMNKEIHTKLDTAKLYSWEKPALIPAPIVIDSYKAVTKILNDKDDWKVTWGEAIEYCVTQPKINPPYGRDFCLAGDNAPNTKSRNMLTKALYAGDWQKEVKTFFGDMSRQYIKKYAYRVGPRKAGGRTTMQIDIVRDMGNLVNAHFVSSVYCLPLKTEDNPRGIYTVQEMYGVLSVLFICIFYDVDPANSFKLRTAARTLTQQLGELVLFNVEVVSKGGGFVEELISRLHEQGRGKLSDYGVHMIQRLLKSGQSIKDLVWTNIIPACAAGVANQAQLFAQCVDYYMGDGKKYLPELNRLAKSDKPEDEEKLLRYGLEGSRLRHTVGLFRRAQNGSVVEDGDKKVTVPKGGKILLNVKAASYDPTVFPNPESVDLERPLSSYVHYGWGPHRCLGEDVSKVALIQMMKATFSLDNLRRAVNTTSRYGGGESQGELKQVPGLFGYPQYMTADESGYFPFPTTMKLQYDGVDA